MRRVHVGVLVSGLALVMLLGVAHLLRPARSPGHAAQGGREEVSGLPARSIGGLVQTPVSGRGEGGVATAVPDVGEPGAIRSEEAESIESLPEDSVWDGFWGSLDELGGRREAVGEGEYRAEALRLTAEFLGFDPATAHAFGQAQLQAQLDLDRVQQAMGGMFVAVPDGLSDEDLLCTQREAEEHYRRDREAALSRLEAHLDPSPRQRQFRERLERWMEYFAGGRGDQ